jgi:hypothetical protein
MEYNFKKMTQDELINYVHPFNDMSSEELKVEEYKWAVMKLSVDELVEKNGFDSNKQEWIKWIEIEQNVRKEEWGYDSIQQISNYWLANPEQEPIIIARNEAGKFDIWDGFHRFGIAIQNKLDKVPVILGEQ